MIARIVARLGYAAGDDSVRAVVLKSATAFADKRPPRW